MPAALSRRERHTHAVHEVNAKKGDCILFSEATTHGTLPWCGRHQRRALLYKFSPGHHAHNPGQHLVMEQLPQWVQDMTEAQRQVLAPPHQRHKDYGRGSRAFPPRNEAGEEVDGSTGIAVYRAPKL